MQPGKHITNITLGIMGMQLNGLGIATGTTFGQGLDELAH